MKITKAIFLILFIAIISCVSNKYIKSVGVFLTDIKLYESDYDGFNKEHRVYKITFNKSETRYINWEIHFYHNNKTRDISFPITAVYHKSDSTEIIRQTLNSFIESHWETSYHNWGWGWDKVGRWEPDKYYIKFYTEHEYIGAINFEIIDDMNLKYIKKIDSYIEHVKLYESDGNKIPQENRIYNNRFPKDTSQVINWELGLQHPFRKNDREFKIKSIYYDQNNQIIATYTNDFFINADWDSSYFHSGWGYSKSGSWEIGKYKVELYISEELIAITEFEIY
ncbi:MAG: hypothetical protein KAT74_07955 [Candidatus Cloacimonetes bacterium]|nr:hypothetical protein [Candidatus Cloacimonadota bacterium]